MLRLKNAPRAEHEGGATVSAALSVAKSWSAERVHVLARFKEKPARQQLQNLEEKGLRLVQYVPDEGYIFSVGRDFAPDDPQLPAVRHIHSEDKVSSLLNGPRDDGAGRQAVGIVAEFYPDVDPQSARSIALLHGFEVVDHPDLLPNHILLRGDVDNVRQLAEWDEIAYVFPASEELSSRQPVSACTGALTEFGGVGQYIGSVGDGWDGPGRGSADLGYFFQQLTLKQPMDQTRAEIQRAFVEWERVASVRFSRAQWAGAPRSLNFLFARGSHGDGFPFDGPGRVLAHTFYPSPPNPEPIAGDLHFDEDEEWVIGPDLSARSVDLFSVSLHELGHALGLGHSDQPGAVMYPYYRRLTALTSEDVRAIQQLYAQPTTTPSPDPPPFPLSLNIVSPTPAGAFSTRTPTIVLAGTASPAAGIARVQWENSRGGSGMAAGTSQWSTGPIQLQPGENVLNVVAWDPAGASASRTLTVSYTLSNDSVAPTLKVTSPAATSVLTSAATIRLQGTASDSSGVAEVNWSTSLGRSGIATGTVYWTAADVPLLVGSNVIIVRARDAAGNTSWRSLTVTRR